CASIGGGSSFVLFVWRRCRPSPGWSSTPPVRCVVDDRTRRAPPLADNDQQRSREGRRQERAQAIHESPPTDRMKVGADHSLRLVGNVVEGLLGLAGGVLTLALGLELLIGWA